MLYIELAQFVQLRAPFTVMGEVFGHSFGNKNVPGVPAIHDALANRTASRRYVRSLSLRR